MWLIDANRLYDAAEEKYMEDRSKTENVITRVMLSHRLPSFPASTLFHTSP